MTKVDAGAVRRMLENACRDQSPIDFILAPDFSNDPNDVARLINLDRVGTISIDGAQHKLDDIPQGRMTYRATVKRLIRDDFKKHPEKYSAFFEKMRDMRLLHALDRGIKEKDVYIGERGASAFRVWLNENKIDMAKPRAQLVEPQKADLRDVRMEERGTMQRDMRLGEAFRYEQQPPEITYSDFIAGDKAKVTYCKVDGAVFTGVDSGNAVKPKASAQNMGGAKAAGHHVPKTEIILDALLKRFSDAEGFMVFESRRDEDDFNAPRRLIQFHAADKTGDVVMHQIVVQDKENSSTYILKDNETEAPDPINVQALRQAGQAYTVKFNHQEPKKFADDVVRHCETPRSELGEPRLAFDWSDVTPDDVEKTLLVYMDETKRSPSVRSKVLFAESHGPLGGVASPLSLHQALVRGTIEAYSEAEISGLPDLLDHMRTQHVEFFTLPDNEKLAQRVNTSIMRSGIYKARAQEKRANDRSSDVNLNHG